MSELRQNILTVVGKNDSQPEGKALWGDGWSICTPEHFIEMGFNEDFVRAQVIVNEGGEGKYALYDNENQPVDSIEGIHYLWFLERCCGVVDPDFYSDKMGRGFRARQLLDHMVQVAEKEGYCDA
jgi:hypothetical protein|tara:strand:+ start:2894 stop:3268 length:375 start_codon:yes stop_codon:yes gene_type:complete